MADKNFEKWRQRLQWASGIWREKGLIGTESASMMNLMIEFYRSNQWQNQTWGNLETDQLRTINKIFPTANVMQATIAARNPRMQYFPRDQDGFKSAPIIQALHNYDIREANHIDPLNAAFRDHQFAPFGVVRHGYTPGNEISKRGPADTDRVRRMDLYRPANKNRPWIKRVAPWNVLFDPNAERFHMDGGMRWVAFRDIVNIENLLDNPGTTISKSKLSAFSGSISKEFMEMRDPSLRNSDDPDADKWLEVWSVYEIETRTWFQMTLDAGIDDYIRKPGDWPIPWEWLPVNIFSVNEQMDTPWAISLMEDLAPLQVELNQVRTMIHQAVLRSRRINLAGDGVDEETMELLQGSDMNEWFKVRGNAANAASSIQSGTLDPSTISHMQIVQDDMRESTGQSRMDRAQRINVESATEASFVQQGSDTQSSRIEERFTRFVRETESLYMQGRRFIMAKLNSSEAISIVGAEDARQLEDFVNVGTRELHGEYSFEVEAGSTRRKDRQVEAQLAQLDLQTGLQVPDIANTALLWRNYVRARGLDPAEATMPDAHGAAQIRGAAATVGQANEATGGGAGGGAGAGAGAGGGTEAGAGPGIDANIANLLNQNAGGG